MNRQHQDAEAAGGRVARLGPSSEEALVAFLEGTLTPEERRSIVAYLAQHDGAREVLLMAAEALSVTENPDL
jgi:hypothetical protein